MKVPFFTTAASWWQRMSGRWTPPIADPIVRRWTDLERAWHEASHRLSPAKCCRWEVQRLQSGEYGGQSAGVQNSAKNGWVVLVVWTCAKSLGRHIFYQKTSYGFRGPHAVLKAVSSCLCWPACWRKLAISGLNPQDLLLVLLGSLLSAAWPLCQVHEVILLTLRSARISLCFCPEQGPEQLAASDLHGDKGITHYKTLNNKTYNEYKKKNYRTSKITKRQKLWCQNTKHWKLQNAEIQNIENTQRRTVLGEYSWRSAILLLLSLPVLAGAITILLTVDLCHASLT